MSAGSGLMASAANPFTVPEALLIVSCSYPIMLFALLFHPLFRLLCTADSISSGIGI